MNSFFDFTPRQLKVLAVLTATVILTGGYLIIRSYAKGPVDSSPLTVFVGEDDRQLRGIFVLDPNTAPADSLELLPGVGRVLADRIVEYRQTHRFEREIDITEVKGIGPKLYEKLQPYLKVRRY